MNGKWYRFSYLQRWLPNRMANDCLTKFLPSHTKFWWFKVHKNTVVFSRSRNPAPKNWIRRNERRKTKRFIINTMVCQRWRRNDPKHWKSGKRYFLVTPWYLATHKTFLLSSVFVSINRVYHKMVVWIVILGMGYFSTNFSTWNGDIDDFQVDLFQGFSIVINDKHFLL